MTGNGYLLSETLRPLNTALHPDRLLSFFRSTNHASVKLDLRYQILYDKSSNLHFSTAEGNAWIDVYAAYWKAIGELLKADAAENTEKSVS